MKLFGFGESRLIKYCNEEHNIALGCNTIRIGTLFEFRDCENEHLRDEGEGKFEFKVKFPSKMVVSPAWLESIELNGGEASARVEELEIGAGTIKTSGFTFSGSTENAWVFCTSAGESGVAGNISSTYSSAWELPEDSIGDFAQNVAGLLRQSIHVTDLPDTIVQNNTISELERGLTINCSWGSVQYDQREVFISDPNQKSPDDIKQLLASISFIKPAEFSREREFRFVFQLQYKGKPISVAGPKILNLAPVSKLVANHSIAQNIAIGSDRG